MFVRNEEEEDGGKEEGGGEVVEDRTYGDQSLLKPLFLGGEDIGGEGEEDGR